jgi:hypothetical protein
MRYFPFIYQLVLASTDPELARFYQWHKDNGNRDSMTSHVDSHAWALFPTEMGMQDRYY